MARWWARMETIIPYRRKRAGRSGHVRVVGASHVSHAPHYLWRQVCRSYVWFRKRRPSARWTRGVRGRGDYQLKATFIREVTGASAMSPLHRW